MNLLARQSHFSHSDGVCFHDTQFQRLFFRFRLSAAAPPPRPFSSEFLSAPTTTSNATSRQLLKPSRDLGCTSRLIHHIGVIPSGCIPTAGCTSRLIHHIGVIPSGCILARWVHFSVDPPYWCDAERMYASRSPASRRRCLQVVGGADEQPPRHIASTTPQAVVWSMSALLGRFTTLV